MEGTRLWTILFRATRTVERVAQEHIKTLGLGISEFAVLEALYHKGPLTAGELAAKVLLTSGSMTAAVDRLVRRELVRREDHPKDRRSSLVVLTEEGRRLIAEAFPEHQRCLDRAFTSLKNEEQAELARLLKKIGKGAGT